MTAEKHLPVIGVCYGKVIVDADHPTIPAQKPYTGGVERAYLLAAFVHTEQDTHTEYDSTRDLRTEQLLQSLPHLIGRLIGECHRRDLVRKDPMALDEIGDPGGKNARLA